MGGDHTAHASGSKGNSLNFQAVIVGAGRGERLGSDVPKCLIEIKGVPLLLLGAWALQKAGSIDEIVLVVPAGYEDEMLRRAHELHFDKVIAAVAGGLERQDSTFAGLSVLPGRGATVLVHDGARALVSPELVERLAATLETSDAAFAALAVTDTLHLEESGRAFRGPDRSRLVAAQTPQGARRDLLATALIKASHVNRAGTDEVTLLQEFADIEATIVEGEASNIKITTRNDLDFYLPQLEERAKLILGNR